MSTGHYEAAQREDMDSPVSQTCPRTLSAREVLDMHADLQRIMARPVPWLREGLKEYAIRDVGGKTEWAASHLHPSTRLDDLEPWLASLGSDLAGAATYQVTAEMSKLAGVLTQANPDIGRIQREDLPSGYGFMWFDQPVPRPSVEDGDRDPLLMHAVSWALVPAMPVAIGGTSFTGVMPAVRLREWGYNNDPGVRPRPLHLMGQNTIPITGGIYTNLTEHWFVHMVWILTGMTITATRTEMPDRHGFKRAANLKHKLINVITLRRPAHADSEKPGVTPRHIDWTCTWLVRGHHRQAPHGGTFADGRTETWVRPYLKGPDGLPLRVPDILYKLSR